MAEYKDGDRAVNPETGETFIYDAKSNQWLPEAPAEVEARQYGPVLGALMKMQQGLTAGYGDDLVAGARSLFGGGSYADEQAQIQAGLDQYAAEHPRIAGASEVTGAALPILATGGAGALPQAGRMIAPRAVSTAAGTRMAQVADASKVGGLYSAAAAGGNMTPQQRMDPRNTLGHMAIEGGKGAVVAGGITGGSMALSTAAQRLREPAQKLYQYVRGQVPGVAPPGPSPAASGAPGGAPGGAAPPVPPPQAGPAPSRGAQGAVLNAIEEGGMTPQSVLAATQAGRQAGVPSMPIDFAGNPAQRLARGVRTVDPKAGNLMDTRMNTRAEGQMERVGREVERGMGAPPVGPAGVQELAETRRIISDPLFAAARARGPITDPRVLQNLQERVSVYQPLHEASRQQIARTRGTGVPPPLYDDTGRLVRPPTADDIQMIKEGADRRLYNDVRGRSEPSSAMAPGDRRNLQMTMRADRPGDEPGLLPLVDEALPEYRNARREYAGATAVQNALQDGLEVVGKSADDVRAIVRNFSSEAERDAFRSGAVYGIRQQLMKAQDRSEYANVLNSIFGWGKGSKREALRGLFPDDASFARFQASMEAEIAAVKSRRFLQSGSNTADKLMEAADVAGIADDAVNTAAGNWVWPAARRAREFIHGRGAGTRYDIADAMTSTQGDDFLLALERMRQERMARMGMSPARLATSAGIANYRSQQ